jgi:hypothetical protein
VTTDQESGQTILKGMGELHLDIKVDILRTYRRRILSGQRLALEERLCLFWTAARTTGSSLLERHCSPLLSTLTAIADRALRRMTTGPRQLNLIAESNLARWLRCGSLSTNRVNGHPTLRL